MWLAYPVGNWVLGTPASAMVLTGMDGIDLLQVMGVPALLGMGVLGVGGAALGYLLVKIGWRLRWLIKRQKTRTAKTTVFD